MLIMNPGFCCVSSAVKGKTPQVGDRVLVEAVYNPNMPFKWNAQRIQTLPQLPNQTVSKNICQTDPPPKIQITKITGSLLLSIDVIAVMLITVLLISILHQAAQPLPQVSPQLSSFYSDAGIQRYTDIHTAVDSRPNVTFVF